MLDYLDVAIVNAVRQVLGGFGVIFASCEILTRLSTFASKTPAVAGVLLIGLHYTAFRDAIREDSRQTTPSRGVTPRKKFAVEANLEKSG